MCTCREGCENYVNKISCDIMWVCASACGHVFSRTHWQPKNGCSTAKANYAIANWIVTGLTRNLSRIVACTLKRGDVLCTITEKVHLCGRNVNAQLGIPVNNATHRILLQSIWPSKDKRGNHLSTCWPVRCLRVCCSQSAERTANKNVI